MAGDARWRCRGGELWSLRVGRCPSDSVNGDLVIGPTKGRRVRTVPLVAQFAQVVREASEGKGPNDHMFPGPRGGVINPQKLSRALAWRALRLSVKTSPPGEPLLHWHDLLHTRKKAL